MASKRINELEDAPAGTGTGAELNDYFLVLDKGSSIESERKPITDLTGPINEKVDAGDVLTKTNTTIYNPTLDYHPATVKHVDDRFIFVSYTWGDVSGLVTKTVSIGANIGTSNYIVLPTIVSPYNPDIFIFPPVISNRTTTSFGVTLAESSAAGIQNVNMEFLLIKR